MPAHLDLTVPDKNDIFDSAQEMLSEIEALRAITGKTGEEKNNSHDVDTSKKAEVTGPKISQTEMMPEKNNNKGRKKKTTANASSESKTYLLKIPANLHRSVRVLAAYIDTNISDYILDAIEEKVKSDKKKHNLEI